MEKYLYYNHPATPQKGVKVGVTYLLEDLQKLFTLDEIKCFFVPDNFKFEDLNVVGETAKKK